MHADFVTVGLLAMMYVTYSNTFGTKIRSCSTFFVEPLLRTWYSFRGFVTMITYLLCDDKSEKL